MADFSYPMINASDPYRNGLTSGPMLSGRQTGRAPQMAGFNFPTGNTGPMMRFHQDDNSGAIAPAPMPMTRSTPSPSNGFAGAPSGPGFAMDNYARTQARGASLAANPLSNAPFRSTPAPAQSIQDNGISEQAAREMWRVANQSGDALNHFQESGRRYGFDAGGLLKKWQGEGTIGKFDFGPPAPMPTSNYAARTGPMGSRAGIVDTPSGRRVLDDGGGAIGGPISGYGPTSPSMVSTPGPQPGYTPIGDTSPGLAPRGTNYPIGDNRGPMMMQPEAAQAAGAPLTQDQLDENRRVYQSKIATADAAGAAATPTAIQTKYDQNVASGKINPALTSGDPRIASAVIRAGAAANTQNALTDRANQRNDTTTANNQAKLQSAADIAKDNQNFQQKMAQMKLTAQQRIHLSGYINDARKTGTDKDEQGNKMTSDQLAQRAIDEFNKVKDKLGGDSASAGGNQDGPVQVSGADDYNKLPSGAHYLDPAGVHRIKP